MAILLIFNTETGQWTMPRLIPQTCEKDRAHSPRYAALTTLPPHLIVLGSVQSLRAGDISEAVASVGLFDGIHGVLFGPRGKRQWHWWLRLDGEKFVLVPHDSHLVYDDYEHTLNSLQAKLRCV